MRICELDDEILKAISMAIEGVKVHLEIKLEDEKLTN
jgi:hypothetical protein